MKIAHNFKDLTNQKFNQLLVLGIDRRKNGAVWWRVLCDCGVEKVVHGNNLPYTNSCGCARTKAGERRIKDLTGWRVGLFMVIGRDKEKRPGRGAFWRCICECGKEKTVSASNLLEKDTFSCGCARKLPYGLGEFRRVYKDYKRNAETRGLVFGLSEVRVKELVRSDCYYCGFSLPTVRPDLQEFVNNGIDRLDNLKGYEEGNVVPCCKTCNHAKGTMTEEEFVTWALRLAQYQSKKATSTPLNS